MLMSLKQTIVILTLLIMLPIYAQQRPVEITYKRNEDKSIDFYYKKISPGSSYIIVNFNRFENAKGKPIIRKSVKGYSGRLFTLEPSDEKRGIGFSYSYSYMKGNIKAKPNTDFKYTLPFKNGKEIHASDLYYLNKRFGNTPPKNWRSIQFLTKPNDTVYASRKGIVVEVVNKFEEDSSSEYSYKREANHIIIEHADGTLAKYGVLKKNGMLVKLGDKVYPSTPIAISGTYDKSENSQLRFEVYYLDKETAVSRKVNEKQTLANKKHYYAYVNPFFHTKNGDTQLNSGNKYVALCDEDIIQLEMAKREKKKWLKSKKK